MVAPAFQNFLIFLILLNSLLSGIAAGSYSMHYNALTDVLLEWRETKNLHWEVFQMISIIDTISLIVFFGEIVLKWIDDFNRFWKDGWNIFDLSITVLSAIPNIIDLFGAAASSKELNNVLSQMRALRIVRTLKIVRFSERFIVVDQKRLDCSIRKSQGHCGDHTARFERTFSFIMYRFQTNC